MSILQMNLDYARENNLPIAASYEKLLSIPGGTTLFDTQYNLNNWEDLAEPLAEQLVAELQSKGQKQFLLDNAKIISYGGASGPLQSDFNNFVKSLNTVGFTPAEAQQISTSVQSGVADNINSQQRIAAFNANFNPGGGFGNLIGDVAKLGKQVAANPITQVALAVYMPTIASYLGPYLTAIPAAYQTAVAGALANTALQTAQGVPFEQALKSATINAVTSTGAPVVADYMLPYVGSTQVADALTSIGASAAKTAAMGGSKDDIEKNMVAALTGSSLTSALQAADVSRETSRIAGATAGGAVVGGTTGAVMGAAGEAGAQLAAEQAAKDAALERAKKGIAAADTGTVSDSGQQLGDVVVTGKKEPTIQDTSIIVSGTPIFADSPRAANVKPPTGFTVMPIQLAENKPAGSYYDIEQNAWLTPIEPTPPAPVPEPSLPTTTVTGKAEPGITDTNIITPTGPITDREVMGAMQPPAPAAEPSLAPVTVTGRREPTIQDTDITLPVTTVTGKREKDDTLAEVTVRGKREEDTLPEVTVTGKREEDTLPEVNVTGKREEEPIAETPVEEEPTVEEKGKPYRPNLFIYGGTKPSTLSRTLGTTVKNLPSASTTTGTSVGLGGRGEIESKESGKKRQTVWNEESLRLKDALGL
jgi:hypothetical protein